MGWRLVVPRPRERRPTVWPPAGEPPWPGLGARPVGSWSRPGAPGRCEPEMAWRSGRWRRGRRPKIWV